MPFLLQEFDAGDTFARLTARLNTGQGEVDEFVRNPVGYLTQTVGLSASAEGDDLGRRLAALPRSQVSQANAFIHALLANPGFVDWMRDYHREMSGQVTAADFGTAEGRAIKRKVMEDFARAMIDFGELRLFVDMIRAGSDTGLARSLEADPIVSVSAWYDGVAVDVETFIYAVLAAAVAAVLTIVAFQIDLTIPAEVPEARLANMSANEMRNLSQQLVDHAQALYGRSREGGGDV